MEMCRSKAEGGRRCAGRKGRASLTAVSSASQSRRIDGKPETEADRKFFDLRESGYTGPIDQDGNIPDPTTASPAMRRALEGLEILRRPAGSAGSQ
jgi:hypothetical protein